jgi:hypothetical protein
MAIQIEKISVKHILMLWRVSGVLYQISSAAAGPFSGLRLL